MSSNHFFQGWYLGTRLLGLEGVPVLGFHDVLGKCFFIPLLLRGVSSQERVDVFLSLGLCENLSAVGRGCISCRFPYARRRWEMAGRTKGDFLTAQLGRTRGIELGVTCCNATGRYLFTRWPLLLCWYMKYVNFDGRGLLELLLKFPVFHYLGIMETYRLKTVAKSELTTVNWPPCVSQLFCFCWIYFIYVVNIENTCTSCKNWLFSNKSRH